MNADTAPVETDMPGFYQVEFLLTSDLEGDGDQPIVVTANAGGVIFSSRLDDTAARIFIL
jgi:hypothetical protein